MSYLFPLTIFYLGFSFFILHEMDAIKNKEWRMLYFLNFLCEDKAYIIFSVLHLPLFVLLLLGLVLDKYTTMKILDSFFILHFILHLLFLKHKENNFSTKYSWFLITGLFIFGSMHLVMISL